MVTQTRMHPEAGRGGMRTKKQHAYKMAARPAALTCVAVHRVQASYLIESVGLWSRECERSSWILSGNLLCKGFSVSVMNPRWIVRRSHR